VILFPAVIARIVEPPMRNRFLCVVAVLAVLLPGCGKPIKLAPAEGVLTIGGKPAANINIQFLPDPLRGGKGPTSYAVTGPDGRFVLKTYDGKDGAVVGPHLIVLVDVDEERPAQGQPLRKAPRLDGRFAIAGKGLTAEVVEGGGPINLETSSVK
jgi:hypothetical protein